jgi:hypothetical protein
MIKCKIVAVAVGLSALAARPAFPLAVAQALTGRKVTPELRLVDGAVLLGPLKGRCAAPARGECQRLTISHVNRQYAHGLRASDRRIA